MALGQEEEITDSISQTSPTLTGRSFVFHTSPAALMVLWKDVSVRGVGRPAGQREVVL